MTLCLVLAVQSCMESMPIERLPIPESLLINLFESSQIDILEAKSVLGLLNIAFVRQDH